MLNDPNKSLMRRFLERQLELGKTMMTAGPTPGEAASSVGELLDSTRRRVFPASMREPAEELGSTLDELAGSPLGMLFPGIPGGPEFRSARHLQETLKHLDMDDLIRFRGNAINSMMGGSGRGVTQRRRFGDVEHVDESSMANDVLIESINNEIAQRGLSFPPGAMQKASADRLGWTADFPAEQFLREELIQSRSVVDRLDPILQLLYQSRR